MACSPRPVEWGWTGTGVAQYTMPAILSFSLIEAGIILCASGSHKLPLLTLSLCDKTVGVCPVTLTRKTQSRKLSALSLLHIVACSEAKKYSFRYDMLVDECTICQINALLLNFRFIKMYHGFHTQNKTAQLS